MKTTHTRVALSAVIIFMAAVVNGCTKMSIRHKSESSGFNGSFEVVQSGLPVNWYFHYPPIKNGDVEISLDTKDAIEGNQSLKFKVHRVDSRPGWRRPGLFQVRSAKSNRSYRVSFWLKNQGCKVSLTINSEKPKSAPLANRRMLGEGETGANTWRQFEYVYTVPDTYNNIRFDLGVVQPGTFWLDDVRIEEMETD